MSGQLINGAAQGSEALELVGQAFRRANRERPRREDIAELKRVLQTHPDAWREGGDLAVYAVDQLVERVNANQAVKLSILAGVAALRRSLGYDTADALERTLIEAVTLSYLRLQFAELHYNAAFEGSVSLTLGIYHEKRLGMAQRRYLRACGELARVRRLLRRDPLVQINVGEAGAMLCGVMGKRGDESSMG
jgi:hypothetical protein